MSSKSETIVASPAGDESKASGNTFRDWLKKAFIRFGVLPCLLIVSVIVFAAMSDNFLTVRNMISVLRQSSYLVVVSMGQMMALLIGGLDLSVGTIVALTSVVSVLAMTLVLGAFPDAVVLAIVAGMLAGLCAGSLLSLITGIGVAVFNVPSFMMTLGLTSTGFGIALYLSGGVPVYGMPEAYGRVLGYGDLFGIPAPVYVTLVIIALMYFVLNWTRLGRYFYAVGGNLKAARLSGINTGRIQIIAHTLCGALAALAGLMLTARLGTGEANIGTSLPLQSIAACVIGGVSLGGGFGRLGGVVLGALLIGLLQNGMNLARVDSYLQIVVIGILLILAVVADRIRQRVMMEERG